MVYKADPPRNGLYATQTCVCLGGEAMESAVEALAMGAKCRIQPRTSGAYRLRTRLLALHVA